MLETLDRLAEEMYGEFGFTTCTNEEQREILKTYAGKL
jgi:hypothetical protein